MDNELKEKLIKAKSKEEVTDLLKAGGRDLSVADKIWNEIAKSREKEEKSLSMDELDAVSGGIFGFGDDAPDGHELNCFVTWYDGWDDFDARNEKRYCKGTKGRKHEFEHFEGIEKGTFIDVMATYDRCKLCGYIKNKVTWPA